MPFCHFSRVYKGTSLADLKAKEQLQISRKCKEVEYAELISILVDQEEFDLICNDVSNARSCYQKYSHQSIATLDGKWKCIVYLYIHYPSQFCIDQYQYNTRSHARYFFTDEITVG